MTCFTIFNNVINECTPSMINWHSVRVSA